MSPECLVIDTLMSPVEKNTKPQTSVLIVDDNVQYAGMLKRILGNAFGYQDVCMVEDIGAAYTLISSSPERFQLLFIDYNFPNGVTGGELLERLQKDEMLRGRVAFLITADPTIENMKQAMAAGAQGVVAKPFNREDLKSKLRDAERSIGDEEGEF